VDVYDLHLEGEDFEYENPTEHHAQKTSLWQICIPVGLGLRWDIGDQYALGVEWLYRFTFHDRLDNVSSEYASPDYFNRHLPPEKAALATALYDKSWQIDPSVKRDEWSKRGNKEVKDGYSSISVTFIYKILNNKMPWWF
jgi:hypothetical protein